MKAKQPPMSQLRAKKTWVESINNHFCDKQEHRELNLAHNFMTL